MPKQNETKKTVQEEVKASKRSAPKKQQKSAKKKENPPKAAKNQAAAAQSKAVKPSNKKESKATQTKQPKKAKAPKSQPATKKDPEKNTASSQKKPAARNQGRRRKNAPAPVREDAVVRIIPLGGLNEVGKNMTVFECGDDMFIVDCGMTFPDNEMLGIDIVIPDYTYVERNKERIRGIVITHAHEDHIGGLPYLMRSLNVPIYTTRFTIGMIQSKLEEHDLARQVRFHEVVPGDTVTLGAFSVEFIAVNHSIPDACALAISTPAGLVIHTGDFKVDYTPIDGPVIDLARFGELGSQGVLALLSDSTNSEKPDSTPSERRVGEAFDRLFKQAGKRRVILATFSSNVHRIQQVINACVKYRRKLAVNGRSMVNVVKIAIDLGYLKAPDGVLVDMDLLAEYTDEQICLVTTGSQGEPLSALTRMAMGEHKKVHVGPNDFIILSATPIPGNEKAVTNVVDMLMRRGAEVIHERQFGVHVSGHAAQEDQKLLLSLTHPKFFVPVHGEFHHLRRHAQTAIAMGVPKENIITAENGRIIELTASGIRTGGTVPVGDILVDGLGVGDIGTAVLRERKQLSENGLVIVAVAIESDSGYVAAGPDIISRGFVYVKESEEMLQGAKQVCEDAINSFDLFKTRDWNAVRNAIRKELEEYIYAKTKRVPIILPILQEI